MSYWSEKIFRRPFGRRFFALGACALLAMPAAAARDLSKFFPAETHAAVWVRNIDEAREQFAGNPFWQFITHEDYGVPEDLRALRGTMTRMPGVESGPLAPVWQGIDRFAENGILDGIGHTNAVFPITANDVVETFNGSAAIYSTMYRGTVEEKTPITEWDVIFAAETEGADRDEVEAFLQKALSRVPDSARRKSRDYFGSEVFHIEYYVDEEASLNGNDADDGGLGLLQEIPILIEYAYVDGVLLLAEGRGEPLKKAIRALKEGDSATLLHETSGYRAAEEMLTRDIEPVIGAYFDLDKHVREWKNLPDRRNDVAQLNAIGIEKSGPLLAFADLDQNGARMEAVLAKGAGTEGIWKVIGEAPVNPLEAVEMVPADAIAFASVSLDLETLYQQALGYYATLMNGPGMITSAVSVIEQQLGVSLKDDFFAGGQGELLSYVRPGSDLSGAVAGGGMIIPLGGGGNAQETFNRMLTNITTGNRPLVDLAKNDVNGVTVWETPDENLQPGASQLHVAATQQGLLMATSGSELRDLLRTLSSGSSDSILRRDRIRREVREAQDIEGLVAFSLTPVEGVEEEYNAMRKFENRINRPTFTAQMRGFQDGLPEEGVVSRYIGDTIWTVRRAPQGVLITYTIEAPER